MFDRDNITQKNNSSVYSSLLNNSWESKQSLENYLVFHIDFENFLIRNLEIREMVILQMLLNGYSQGEIAKHQRVTRETINRFVKVIKIKFYSFFSGSD